MNVFQYAESSEIWWKNAIASVSPYKPFTTFFYDLSIADCFGQKGIKDTYKQVIKTWGKNIKYMTEFAMCLNYKIWQLHEINAPIAKLYEELYFKCCDYISENFEGDELKYFLETTD